MPQPDLDARRERHTYLLWTGGLVAAAVLLLGVNGTLSSWTTAIINNNHNEVASASSVSLLETGPGGTCDTSGSPDNTDTCSTINKFGGTSSPLSPSGSQQVTVTLQNTGTTAGDLVLSADACTNSAAGPNAHLGQDLCTRMDVRVACTTPSAFDSGTGLLADFTGGDVGTLAAGESTGCAFTLSLPDGTPAEFSSQVASQVLHWTLTAA